MQLILLCRVAGTDCVLTACSAEIQIQATAYAVPGFSPSRRPGSLDDLKSKPAVE